MAKKLNIVELHKYKCLDCGATFTDVEEPKKCTNPNCPSNRSIPIPKIDRDKLIAQQKAQRAAARQTRQNPAENSPTKAQLKAETQADKKQARADKKAEEAEAKADDKKV